MLGKVHQSGRDLRMAASRRKCLDGEFHPVIIRLDSQESSVVFTTLSTAETGGRSASSVLNGIGLSGVLHWIIQSYWHSGLLSGK